MLRTFRQHRREAAKGKSPFAGQALLETVIVLVTIPAMLIMFNASFYFGRIISSQIRLTNFARYAAIKVGRSEQVNLQGVMDNNTVGAGRIPGYQVSRSNNGQIIAAVANAVTFIVNPLFVGQPPLIFPMIAAVMLPFGHDQTTVNASFTETPPRSLSFVTPTTFTARVTIDGKSWTHGPGMANEGILGRLWPWFFRLMYFVQDLVFHRLSMGNPSIMEFGLFLGPVASADQEILAAIFSLTIIEGLINFIQFFLP